MSQRNKQVFWSAAEKTKFFADIIKLRSENEISQVEACRRAMLLMPANRRKVMHSSLSTKMWTEALKFTTPSVSQTKPAVSSKQAAAPSKQVNFASRLSPVMDKALSDLELRHGIRATVVKTEPAPESKPEVVQTPTPKPTEFSEQERFYLQAMDLQSKQLFDKMFILEQQLYKVMEQNQFMASMIAAFMDDLNIPVPPKPEAFHLPAPTLTGTPVSQAPVEIKVKVKHDPTPTPAVKTPRKKVLIFSHDQRLALVNFQTEFPGVDVVWEKDVRAASSGRYDQVIFDTGRINHSEEEMLRSRLNSEFFRSRNCKKALEFVKVHHRIA